VAWVAAFPDEAIVQHATSTGPLACGQLAAMEEAERLCDRVAIIDHGLTATSNRLKLRCRG
jgi:ABC-type Na+ transport system ATPase subunit NatA